MTVQRVDDAWISLADGTRLAARMWLPMVDEPVPVILEYLPYRQGDGTWPRDEPIGRWFAEHGFAFVRVDIRGTGNSDGVITDEYTLQEHDDGVEVIAWLAEQAWCTGDVGMIGISWGGFNGLQLAARRPPALKAVVTMCSTDDRYADDVHYDGGCLLSWDMIPWAAITFAMNALPPDPEVVGDRWREMWMHRLENTNPFSLAWLDHQRRDDYWKHGSVCEDYALIECPVFVVGGWADGYTNAIPRLVEHLPGIRKGLIGPWPHDWPHKAEQGPRIAFLDECRRWFDRWLRGEESDVENDPLLTVWMQDPLSPPEQSADRHGQWVTESEWPPASVTNRRWFLSGDRSLSQNVPTSDVLDHRGFQHHGLLAGTWCPYGPAADYPPDQREEDALCLTFDSDPLPEDLVLLGNPRTRLRVSADVSSGFVMVRLCDVAPDGTSLLVSRGSLNLTHRGGHEKPTAIVPGEPMEVDVELDILGQTVPAGHCLRLAVSTTYWPWLWPSPEPVTISVGCGEDSWLQLPVRSGVSPESEVSFGPAEKPDGLSVVRESEEAFHIVEHDIVRRRYVMRINQDGDSRTTLPNGITLGDVNRDTFTIEEDDPLSAAVRCERHLTWSRVGVDVDIKTVSTLSSTESTFEVTEHLVVEESGEQVYEGTWSRTIPRDHL